MKIRGLHIDTVSIESMLEMQSGEGVSIVLANIEKMIDCIMQVA